MKQISRFGKKEVEQILKTAQMVVRHPGLNILVSPHINQQIEGKKTNGKILIITPRKVGTSPQRNKIRRRLKAIFYEQKLFEHGVDCIVIVKKPGIDLSFEKLKSLLIEAMGKMEKL